MFKISAKKGLHSLTRVVSQGYKEMTMNDKYKKFYNWKSVLLTYKYPRKRRGVDYLINNFPFLLWYLSSQLMSCIQWYCLSDFRRQIHKVRNVYDILDSRRQKSMDINFYKSSINIFIWPKTVRILPFSIIIDLLYRKNLQFSRLAY